MMSSRDEFKPGVRGEGEAHNVKYSKDQNGGPSQEEGDLSKKVGQSWRVQTGDGDDIHH